MEPTAGKCFTSLIFVSHFVWTTLVKRSIHPFVVDLSQNRGSASINQKWFKSDLSITKSCSLNFMGLLYIYGGLYEKRQVLKLDWCRNYIWYRNIVYPLFCVLKKTDNFSSCNFFKHSFKNSRTGKNRILLRETIFWYQLNNTKRDRPGYTKLIRVGQLQFDFTDGTCATNGAVFVLCFGSIGSRICYQSEFPTPTSDWWTWFKPIVKSHHNHRSALITSSQDKRY